MLVKRFLLITSLMFALCFTMMICVCVITLCDLFDFYCFCWTYGLDLGCVVVLCLF